MALYEEKRKSFTVNYTSMPQHLLEAAETVLGYPLINYVFLRRKVEFIRLPLVFEGRLQGVLWVWGANDMAVKNL